MSASPIRLLGQGDRFARALRAARGLQLPHAMLLVGARGTGKSSAALVLAQALLCEAGSEATPCGTCSICARVAAVNHPDLYLLKPPEEKQEIPVESVRELQSVLGRLAMEGRARVAILDPADALNEQGQNALLKTLEEPGGDAFLLLTAMRPEQLLPTVLSRLQRLPIRPLEPVELSGELERRGSSDPALRALVVPLAQGSLGLAEVLLAEDLRSLHALVEQAVGAGASKSPPALGKELLAGATGRSAGDARVRLVLLMLRRAMQANARQNLASSDMTAYAPRDLDRWISRCEALCDAETDLDLQLPPELALAGALAKIAER